MKKPRVNDLVVVELAAGHAIALLNKLKYNRGELMSSEQNREVSAIRHRLHVALGETEAQNGKDS